MTAEVTQIGFLDMQVCVPEDWSDEQVVAFADRENPAGTTMGWLIRKEGHRMLRGDPERARCERRSDHVHIMLEVVLCTSSA